MTFNKELDNLENKEKFNIVNLLGITYKEDIISNLITGLINESKNFKIAFLENMIGIKEPMLYEVKAYTRIATSMGIPDIIIVAKNKNESNLIIIENKLKAEEGNEQTKRYADSRCIKELCENANIKISQENLKKKFLFLTLIPEQFSTSEKFINVTYKDLMEKVNIEIEDSTLNRIYNDFISVLKDFYSIGCVNIEDKLIDILCKDIDNEKRYMNFKNIMTLFKSNKGLKVDYIGKVYGKGRVYFISKILKSNWSGKDKADLVDNLYKVGAETFDIHFEGTFDILKGNISLPLHYETLPYIPKAKLESKSNTKDYECYLNRRDAVKKIIHEEIIKLNDPNIKIYNGSNQIASIKINVQSTTIVGEFIASIEKYIDRVAPLVDSALEMVKKNKDIIY